MKHVKIVHRTAHRKERCDPAPKISSVPDRGTLLEPIEPLLILGPHRRLALSCETRDEAGAIASVASLDRIVRMRLAKKIGSETLSMKAPKLGVGQSTGM